MNQSDSLRGLRNSDIDWGIELFASLLFRKSDVCNPSEKLDSILDIIDQFGVIEIFHINGFGRINSSLLNERL